MSLELRHLAALRAIAETGTFAGGADALGYSQSAISQQIAALERITESKLLNRRPGHRPIGLTPAGRVLLRHGEAMLQRAQAARADLAAVAHGSAGTLRVGTYPSVGAHLLPTLLVDFSADWPQVEIELHESNRDLELLARLEDGELDLVLCMLPPPDGPFVSVQLLSDPYVLVQSADSTFLPSNGSVDVKDLAHAPLISHGGCRDEHRVETHLRARGVRPRFVFKAEDNGTLQAFARAGVGAALMPRLTVDIDDDLTSCIEVDGELPPRLIGIVRHDQREPSPAARAFVELARQVSHALDEEPSGGRLRRSTSPAASP